MTEQAVLDHTVINVRDDMDTATDLFRRLGFTLTERGYHSLGSINHLMMFGTDYLELIGLPKALPDGLPGRPDIGNAPLGLNGLVFKTNDATANFNRLSELGISSTPPKSFTRPVNLNGGEVEASFTTAHVTEGTFPGGRVYFCQHHTPDIVWREEWQQHANGATAIPEFVVASRAYREEAEVMSRLLDTEIEDATDGLSIPLKESRVTFLSPEAYADRYGELAVSMDGRPSIFGAMQIRTDDLDKIRAILAAEKEAFLVKDKKDRVLVKEPTFNTLIEFTV